MAVVMPVVTPITQGRIVTHPIFPELWQVRVPCPYSSGEQVAYVGTLPGCIEHLRRAYVDR